MKSKFVGPAEIFPNRADNYRSNYVRSTVCCLSSSPFPMVLFSDDRCQINQCLIFNPSIDEYHLFTFDSIDIKTKENHQSIKSIVVDPLSCNVYYVCDSLWNIYSIEVSAIEQIKEGKANELDRTQVRHLIQFNYPIEAMALIRSTSKGQYFAIIHRTETDREKVSFLRYLFSADSLFR